MKEYITANAKKEKLQRIFFGIFNDISCSHHGILHTNRKMNSKTKERIIKIIIYLIVGFACAFFWHQIKK